MVSGFLDSLRKLPNPAEATALLKEVNILVECLEKVPSERFKAITNLLDDVIELQKQNPGNTEPLKMAVELVGMINTCDIAKIQEIRQCIKEAGKLPLGDLLTGAG